MTLAYNEHLSATQRAWREQGPVTLSTLSLDQARDFDVAARRTSGPWIPEHDVLGALEPNDG